MDEIEKKKIIEIKLDKFIFFIDKIEKKLNIVEMKISVFSKVFTKHIY